MSEDTKGLHPWEKQKLDDQFGISAKVERTEAKGENSIRANRALGDIGNFVKDDCGIEQLRDALYMGSAAVHYYYLPGLKTILNVCQTDSMQQVSEYIASEGLNQLKQELRVYYGRNRVVRRSGV